ncbi:MAG TPA: outer membrane lipoprotein-sorting protein [Candidatus Omnitrophota bacterium]|nr:outer membrane lipoprotein-sorting protein [Candidatus Omnitrophota bacterium]HQO57918.1 outer membrane lipoprotein-sorting protein [Candidatus Omnitrophota bacterium]HQP11572.1 outer membrane lipoprotein-sorting protein [Candidatus Omnitrophota bacterium]
MKLNFFRFFLLLFLCTFPLYKAQGEELSAKEYIKRSDDLMRGNTNQGLYIMDIKTPSWERSLELQVYNSGRNRTFIRILSPAKEAGIGTLRVESEMWNYLPNVEKTIKIPPSMMLQPWMGSDFANDDLVKESSIVEDYNHRVVGEKILQDKTILKIELTPEPDAPVIWGKIYRWIRKEDYVPLKEAYYNEKGELIKTLYYLNEGRVSDRIIPRTWTMKSEVKPGCTTTIRLKAVEYDKTIPDDIYTLTHLKKIQ